WLALLKKDIDVFACDWDVIHAGMYAMYAASASVEGDCYSCVPRVARVEAASLGAFDSASTCAEHEEALHTFTLNSGTRAWRHCSPLSGGLSFTKNLVATSVLQDQWVTVTQLGGELVAICTDSRTGEHLTTFTRRPGSDLYRPTTKSALVAESGQVAASVEGGERYFLLVVDDYMRYTTVFPLQSKAEVRSVLIRWIHAVCRQLSARFQQELPVLRLHSDRGGEFSSGLLEDFCGAEGICQTFTLLASPQQNGIAECRIGLVMEVARTSIVHAAAPHFLWSFAVRYIAEQLNLWPRVSHPETSPALRWRGEVGDASAFRGWGALSLVCDLPAGKLSPCTLRCDVTFDESVCFYRLHPHRSSSVPLPPLALVSDRPPRSPLTPLSSEGGDPTPAATVTPRCSARLAVPPGFPPRPSSPPLQHVAVDSSAAGGGATGGADSGGADSRGAECPLGIGGTGGAGDGGPGTSRQEALSPKRLREWAVHWGSPGGGASRLRAGGAGTAEAGGAGTTGAGGSATGGTGVASAGGTGARRQETLSPEKLRKWAVQWGSLGGGASRARLARAGARTTGATRGTGGAAAGSRRKEPLSLERLREWAVYRGNPGGGAGRASAAGSGGAGLGGASAGVLGADPSGGTSYGGTGVVGGTGGADPGGASPGVPGVGRARGTSTGGTGAAGGTGGAGPVGASAVVLWQELLSPQQLREWAVFWRSPGGGAGGTGSRGAVATGAGGSGGATTQPHPSALRHLLSLPPAVTEFPVAGTTPPLLFPPTDQSQLQLLPDSPMPAPAPYTAVTKSLIERREPETRASTPENRERETRASVPARRVALPSPPASSLPHVSDPDSDLVRAASLTVTRLLATVVTDPSFESAAASALVAELIAMDAEMASWKSTSMYVDKVPPPGANIVDGMWIFRVKRPPGSPPAIKARYVARGFNQREGVDFFQTFSPTPKMTTLRVLWHIAAQRDYELHSLNFSTAFLQGSLHKAIWLRRPYGFIGSFPEGTQWSLRRPVYGLRQAPCEWHDKLRTTLAALGFAPSTADPSQFLRTDTSLPLFYVLVYVDDLVFATADTEALALVKAELQERHNQTDMGELRSYLGLQITRDKARHTITLTQSHMVQQVLQRFDFTWSSPQSTPLSTSHLLSAPPSDESVEPSGPYPMLVGCLISNCEAEIYVGAMAAQELRWPTYLLTDLGERPRSPPILYVDNKAMIALCQDQRLEHRMKHIALR
ncbi:unnamed protein product, partial [Closterium sp. NIES-54]